MADPEVFGTLLTETDGIALRTAERQHRFVLRGAAEIVGPASTAFGLELPAEPCRAAQAEIGAALWLGPDEWLLLAPDDIAAALSSALQHLPHALVDVSDRSRTLVLAGPDVEDVLAAGCPLDLDIGAFPVDACTRTLFGEAEVVLWRRAPHTFHIEVTRSFLAYVVDLLDLAIRDAAAMAHQAPPHPSL